MPARKVKINEKKVARLALDGCQMRTIARIMDIEESVLRRRCTALVKKKRAERRHKLLKAQNILVEKGDKAMLIWLGKSVLNQTERKVISGDSARPFIIELHEFGGKEGEKKHGDTD